MTTVFSGDWQQSNQALLSKLSQLSECAEQNFDIEISITKMLEEAEYRNLVITELGQLGHRDITKITHWLATPSVTDNTSNKDAVASQEVSSLKKTNQKKSPTALLITLTVLITLLASVGSMLWYQNTSNNLDSPSHVPPLKTTKSQLSAAQISANNSILATNQELPAQYNKPLTTKTERSTVFRLHGSNTIGEKLAPMLLEGFLNTRNITDFSWVEQSPLERTLHYTLGDKNYAIELKAHGSSTAFTALNTNSADIGMSSRRIKAKEIDKLAKVTGHLNKLGNEHIIGLDGLAVIINQNNPVKQLSSATLAKIFSGEIKNWAQVGGPSLPIKLYARDAHSGTWDTFKKLVLKKHDTKLSAQAERFESSSELSTLVSQNEAAIGFIGLNYVLHNKAVAIAASQNSGAIYPTRFTVGTEDYALARRLYFYTPTSAPTIVKDFAQYALSNSGQEIVAEAGLISQNIKLEQVYPLQDAPQKYQEYAAKAKRLSLNFRFDYATKDLDNKGKRDLQRLVDFMANHQSSRLILMGFSDSVGAKAKNNKLSKQRGKSVELALTSRGIPVLAVEGMGEALPIANNDTEDGRKRNRRVEVWLL